MSGGATSPGPAAQAVGVDGTAKHPDILFLGLLYDPAIEQTLIRDGRVGLQAAINQYQWGLIDGLARIADHVHVVASYPLGAFPATSRKVLYSRRVVRSMPKLTLEYPATLNLWIIRELIRAITMVRAVERQLRDGRDAVLVVYSLQVAFSLAVHALKRRHPDLRVILVVADIPGKYGVPRRWWTPRGLWERLIGPLHSQMVRDADALVLLTDQMREVLKVDDRPSVVVEGFSPEPANAGDPPAAGSKFSIAYTGTLEMAFGLKDLFEAFALLPVDEYELWIAGDGPARPYVMAQTAAHENVKYLGFLDQTGVEGLQRRSTVLVNPRSPEGAYTRYSFPSKTLAYLAAGRPVIMHRLAGIPREYEDHLFYIDGNTPEALAHTIAAVCSLGRAELEAVGRAGQEWAASTKSPEAQARKVASLWE
jgi:glycosyltransferase involved in cell wall biosynthesis